MSDFKIQMNFTVEDVERFYRAGQRVAIARFVSSGVHVSPGTVVSHPQVIWTSSQATQNLAFAWSHGLQIFEATWLGQSAEDGLSAAPFSAPNSMAEAELGSLWAFDDTLSFHAPTGERPPPDPRCVWVQNISERNDMAFGLMQSGSWNGQDPEAEPFCYAPVFAGQSALFMPTNRVLIYMTSKATDAAKLWPAYSLGQDFDVVAGQTLELEFDPRAHEFRSV